MSIFSVITSYSIHYTKLYEVEANLLNPLVAAKTASVTAEISIVSFLQYFLQSIKYAERMTIPAKEIRIPSFSPSVSRITSYNVCYTKLLRYIKIYRLIDNILKISYNTVNLTYQYRFVSNI